MTRADVKRQGQETVEHGRPTAGGGSTPDFTGLLRGSLTSGVAAGVGGGVVLLSGLRALRRGQWSRAVVRLLVGGLLLSSAARQRRSGSDGSDRGVGVDQDDVVTTAPDVGHVDEAGLDEDDHASGEAAREVAESSVDVEDASSATEETTEIDFETGVESPQEGIGSGTFDARRGVPVPEAAFEEGFLDIDGEAFWAIRDSDDTVFVSRRRSVFEESDGVEYVTSSEVDDEQTLSVPEVILDHWEGVDDTRPVEDADELVFATSDDLRWVDVLWVVSEHRTDEFEGL